MTRRVIQFAAVALAALAIAAGTVRAARLTLTVELNGEPLQDPRLVKYYVYEPEDREAYLAWGYADRPANLPAGEYDIIVKYVNDKAVIKREMTEVEIRGDINLPVRFRVEVASLNVTITQQGVPVDPFTGRYTVYPVGKRSRPVVSRRPGRPTTLKAGTYDIEVAFRGANSLQAIWLERYEATGDRTENVEMGGQPLERSTVSPSGSARRETGAATLRVLPPRSGAAPDADEVTLLLVVDSSAEMQLTMDGRSRLDQARWAIEEALLDLSGSGVRIGLRAYGITPHSRRDTRDSVMLVPPGRHTRPTLAAALDLLRPSGMAAMGYALEQAGSDLPKGGRNWIALFAGARDDAGGDPCEAASRLTREGRAERIVVVALDPAEDALDELSCVGETRAVRRRGDLKSAVRNIFRDARNPGPGTVTLFEPGGKRRVASGDLGRAIEVPSGRYDVLIRAGSDAWVWRDVEIAGKLRALAGPEPRF